MAEIEIEIELSAIERRRVPINRFLITLDRTTFVFADSPHPTVIPAEAGIQNTSQQGCGSRFLPGVPPFPASPARLGDLDAHLRGHDGK